MFSSRGFLTVPLAIIIAGLLIGLSIIYAVGKNATPSGAGQLANVAQNTQASENLENNVAPVSKKDHLLGDANAPIKLIEFSDPECPFCKRFHTTLQNVFKKNNGKVAWVYRYFPLDSLHSKARKESEAIECAAELGGNNKFWAYLDRLMEITPSNNGLDSAELPRIAAYVGLDVATFTACLTSGRTASRVENDYQEAITSGGQGTPYSVAIGLNGKRAVIAGAYPEDSVQQTIDSLLR